VSAVLGDGREMVEVRMEYIYCVGARGVECGVVLMVGWHEFDYVSIGGETGVACVVCCYAWRICGVEE